MAWLASACLSGGWVTVKILEKVSFSGSLILTGDVRVVYRKN